MLAKSVGILVVAFALVVASSCDYEYEDSPRAEDIENDPPDEPRETNDPNQRGWWHQNTLSESESESSSESTVSESEETTSTSTPEASSNSSENASEQERLDNHDGTGDEPFGDGPNDGRFSDVECRQGECFYQDGTIAAIEVHYTEGSWYWYDNPISQPGDCPTEDSCHIEWDHETTSPVAVPD